MNGRKTDVLIKDVFYTDPKTGVEIMNDRCFTVWADAKLKELIKGVEGVTNVYNTFGDTEYSVYFDARYDREIIKKEVEATILCRE